MRFSVSVLGSLSIVLIAAACGSDGDGDGSGGGSGSETACEKVCRRAGEVDAACSPSGCASDCEKELDKCDSEYRDLVDCFADTEMLACETNSGKPVALNDCEAENDAFGACLLTGSGGAGAGGSGAGGGSGGTGNTGPCDPLMASCVACGSETCDAPGACCWDDPSPACGTSGSCAGGVESTCDGAEDCGGGSCCVAFSTTMDGSASSGKAVCSAAGGSVCCAATPGTAGCSGDKTVEMCVCAQDDYCCNMEWDAQCVMEVEEFGCAVCGDGCEMGNASTGSGSSIKSVACRTSSDCSGVVGEFGVPYSECCKASNFGVGACVSQTYAGAIADSGGSCN